MSSCTADSTAYFYPRSPRGERPAGRCRGCGRGSHFYPRSPRGERRKVLSGMPARRDFYPRSPRGERLTAQPRDRHTRSFLSTLPARGATWVLGRHCHAQVISIHAPREGSDLHSVRTGSPNRHFYPRSPRGERPAATPTLCTRISYFYPRSPRGERPRPKRMSS